ncbi:MAG: gamma-glutamylcyclotransferase family protein [Wenzhouxiangellaceae bacterium]
MATQARFRRLYFAYGSNLLPARLRERTPSARIVGAAVLPGYRLAWHKHGIDDSGKCDIVATDSGADQVHGALYAIESGDWPALDFAEELGTGYAACSLRVRIDGRWRIANSYRALRITPELRPFDWYKAFVVQGARAHALPGEYIRALSAVPVWPDPDQERHSRNLRILGAASSAD